MNEIAEKWVELTDRDLSGAQVLLAAENYVLACYHCQQALEKALKAYIFAVLGESENDRKFWTHDLIKLAKLSKLNFSQKMQGLLFNLNPFTTEARYEIKQSKTLAQLVPKICEQYVSNTEEFVSWIKNML